MLCNNREEPKTNVEVEPNRDGRREQYPEYDWSRINCFKETKIKNSTNLWM